MIAICNNSESWTKTSTAKTSQHLSNAMPQTTPAYSLPVENFIRSLDASLEKTLSASLSGLT